MNISSLSDNSTYLSNDPAVAKLWIAGVLGFNSGIFLVIFINILRNIFLFIIFVLSFYWNIKILLSILHVGVLTKYLSDAIINGFTTGAAYHVIVSQLAPLLGVAVQGLHLSLDGWGLQFVIIGVRNLALKL